MNKLELTLTPCEEMSNFAKAQETELAEAREKFGNIKSLHEGLAVVWEEFDELKMAVFKKSPNFKFVVGELVQIAAMCQRMQEDLKL